GQQLMLPEQSNGQIRTHFGSTIVTRAGNIGFYHERTSLSQSINTTNVVTYSHSLLCIGKGTVTGGIAFKYNVKKFFADNLSYPDEIDPRSGFTYSTNQKPVASRTGRLGFDAGFWYTSQGLIAGLSASNVQVMRNSKGDLKNSSLIYQAHLGYQLSFAGSIRLVPMLRINYSAPIASSDVMLLASYKDKIMAGATYTNISPKTLGDFSVYGGIRLKERINIFTSYGQNMEWKKLGLNQYYLNSGINYQLY
nr:type IX secretion system membrane protein PorP/SprF [Bacteroidota bacterium]